MSQDLAALWIGNTLEATITKTGRGHFIAFRDSIGTHFSIQPKSETLMHIELSSDRPIGSSWDAARVGIARKDPELLWKNAEQHSHYLFNREIEIPKISAKPLFSYSRLGAIKEAKPRHEKLLKLNLKPSSDRWQIHILISPTMVESSDDCCSYNLDWAALVFSLAKRQLA